MQQSNSNLFDLQVDAQASSYLSETAKWAKFLAIVGVVMCVLVVVGGAGFAYYLSASAEVLTSTYSGVNPIVFIIYFLVIAIIGFFPCLFLLRFASAMQASLRNNDQQKLQESFRNLKSCFKFIGILTIIGLALYGLVILFALIFAAAKGI